MAKISLRNYNRLIENMVENGQHDEAIAHCRHILQTFPKYIEAYRLLGKAYLESKRYTEAVDIFQRVLMSAPDDFVSHVGLSIIADDQSKLDDAIWHMERAFETQPSNAAIQGELQRLFGRRDGVEPPKIRLTRGALAHMYVQGELFTQAVSEIRAVLVNDPQRTDMQLLLAKAYFHMGQKADASDSCSQLLKRHPYCFDACRILVEILRSSQSAESTQVYRQRVIELEPYCAFAQDSVFHPDQVADAAVNLEQLEYKGQAVDMGTNWGGNLGIGLATDVTVATPSSSQPDWLKQQAAPPASSPDEEAAPASQSQEPIPDFLRQAGWGESDGAFQESPSATSAAAADETETAPAVQADLPDWVKAMAPVAAETPPAIPANAPVPPPMDIPDWLQGLDKSQPAAPAPPAQTPSTIPSTNDLPDWLRNLDKGQPAAPVPAAQTPASTPPSNDLPDWLGNLDKGQSAGPTPQPPTMVSQAMPASTPQPQAAAIPPKPSPVIQSQPPATQQPVINQPVVTNPQPVATTNADPLGGLGKSVQEQDDAMAWLESLAAKHGAKAEELVTDPNARTDVAPDWVDKAKTFGETPAATPAPADEQPPAESDDQTGMWLRNLESNEAVDFAEKEETPESSAASEPSDWLSGLSDSNAFAQISNEPGEPAEEAPILGAQDTPDWLKDMQPAPAQPSEEASILDTQDTPDWLKDMQPAPAQPSEEASTLDAQDTPDWLKDDKQAAPAQSEEGDVPVWLRGMESVQPAEPVAPPATSAAPSEIPASVSPPVDLPAWLASLDDEPSTEVPSSAPTEELPAWLANEAEPQAVEPTQARDWHPVEAEPKSVEPDQVAEWSIPVEPPAPVKTSTREISFEVERPRPVKRSAPKPPRPARKPEAGISLEGAQSEMGRGNIGAAIDVYVKLIHKGKSLEEIIRDLREALYRYPVEVSLWQVLGDAYMRSNRLQEALDAYTKAEELLR
jgi:cytochrome c-type biogenesis protein CcmH/NrfG